MMALKDLLNKTRDRLRSIKFTKSSDYQPEVDKTGMLNEQAEATAGPEQPNESVLVKPVPPAEKNVQLEKLQEGFNQLIVQLHQVNEHLGRQLDQHQQLMTRMDKLPELLHSVPTAVENQVKVTEQTLEQLKASAAKDSQFIEAVERIPTETAKQTDALGSIDHQLAAAADCDAQMAQRFGKFTESLEELNQNTANQTDSIMQMSKTYAASDRYLKYILARDKKRMFWLFVISIGVCVFVLLALVGIIIYLRH